MIGLKTIREADIDSSYIEEVPEEMEVTTRFTGTVGQKTGFRSDMTGLMKTGGLMKTLKSTVKQSYGTEQKTEQSKTQTRPFAKRLDP